jgi:DNA ligase-1
MTLRPMKCETADDLSRVKLPMYVSTKVDGWRCTAHPRYDGRGKSKPLTASLKDLVNPYVSMKMSELPPGLDGELAIVVNGAADFRLSGMFARKYGMPDFRFFIFDDFTHRAPFSERYEKLKSLTLPDFCEVLEQRLVTEIGEVEQMFLEALAAGHEGLVLTAPDSPYKHGRATALEGYRWKMKPWKDTEAKCIGIEEEYQNANEAKVDERGLTKRSGHQANMIPKGRMGKLICEDKTRWPVPFGVSGFTAADKAEYWKNPPIGEFIKFKYLTVGGYDVPRQAQFLGIRHPDDMERSALEEDADHVQDLMDRDRG